MKSTQETKIYGILYLVMAMLSLTACDSSYESDFTTDTVTPYCVICYSSSGDKEHDAIIKFLMSDLVSSTKGTNCAVTYMLKPAEGCGDTVNRYYGGNGEAKKDESWEQPTKGFPITKPETLAEFIKWSAEQFPNHRYVLVTIGHGEAWMEEDARDDARSRTMLYDDGYWMKSYQLTDAVKASGVKIDAFLTSCCLQGSIEHLTEWKGVADYVASNSTVHPDCSDSFGILVSLLNGITTNKGDELGDAIVAYYEALAKYAKIEDTPVSGTVVDMKKIDAVNEVLRETFAYMLSSLDKKSVSTDKPAILGETYRSAFQRAIKQTYKYEFAYTKPADVEQMLYDCTMYSADPVMIRHMEDVIAAIDDAILYRFTTDTRPDIFRSWSICANLSLFKGNQFKKDYSTTAFTAATGYLDLISELAKDN